MRIAVLGAGAVGGHLAARLACAGHDVSLLARGATLAAVRESGLTVRAGDEVITAQVRASDRAESLGAQDLVIFAVKANALHEVAPGIAALLGPDTAVMFAQNGLPWWYALKHRPRRPGHPGLPDLSALDPAGVLAHAIEPRRIVGAVAYTANTVMSPGVIHNQSPRQNKLVVGNIDDTEDARLHAIRTALVRAGIQSPRAASIRQEIWQKLLSNLVSGMTVLAGEPTSVMLEDAKMRAMADKLVGEAAAVAAAHGIHVNRVLPEVPVNKKPSILVDYQQCRPMEVEAMFLAPLAFARAAGVPAPTLEAVAEAITHKAAAQGSFTRPPLGARSSVHEN